MAQSIINEPTFDFPFYCHNCKTKFKVPLTPTPKEVVCPSGHKIGTWSFVAVRQQQCRICKNQPIITELHVRKRHDQTTPTGKPIIVEGTDEELQKIFEHFAEHHPKILLKSGMVKIERG
jgi:hypothetical protein